MIGPMETKRPAPSDTQDGDFYVEPDCCLLCGVPESIAPNIFETGENHCSVKRQPTSQDEVDRTVRAMWSSEVDCIRYRGRDTSMLRRLARAGMADRTDHPIQSESTAKLRDHVSFYISAETNLANSAHFIADAFRDDMRTGDNRVLPVIFGRRDVWVSWYQNRFHLVRFIDGGSGLFIASLRSRTALQGLAWLVDDWLRARRAHGICWKAAGSDMPESATPM